MDLPPYVLPPRDPNTKAIILTTLAELGRFFESTYNSLLQANTQNALIVAGINEQKLNFQRIYAITQAYIQNVDFSNANSINATKLALFECLNNMQIYLFINPNYINENHPLGDEYHIIFNTFCSYFHLFKEHLQANGLLDMPQLSPQDQVVRTSSHESKRGLDDEGGDGYTRSYRRGGQR